MSRSPVIVVGSVLWIIAVGTFLFVHFDAAQPEIGPIAFNYHGFKMKIDHSDIDIVNFVGPRPFLQLTPDLGEDRSVQKVPYVIELGRLGTGRRGSDGRYNLGFKSYKDGEHSQTQLGDGYVMYCSDFEHQSLAFDCAVLLKNLPLAALKYRQRPANVAVAKQYVNAAEAFLKQVVIKADD